jgi:hypothetical protein
MTGVRCEIGLVLEYAFWTYPAIREMIDESCATEGRLHAQLARGCVQGEGRLVSTHDYWLCAEHASLLPVLDEVVIKAGHEPRIVEPPESIASASHRPTFGLSEEQT